MSRREQIKMSAEEAAAFLADERTVTCATAGPRGWPHLMPLWYVPRDAPPGEPGPRIWSWTYGASQKVRNLERDPRVTLQVEAGEAYQELRGLMLECEAVIHRDLDTVASLGGAILLRNSVPRGQQPPPELPAEARPPLEAQAPKRVALEFVERRRTSWDHSKLAGAY
jgi:Pyridoxamine 5'-phosphate oxidase